MFSQKKLSYSLYKSIKEGWQKKDSEIIKTFSEVFEKQLLTQLSKYANRLHILSASAELKKIAELMIVPNKPFFNLNDPFQVAFLLLTFKCYKLAFLTNSLTSLNLGPVNLSDFSISEIITGKGDQINRISYPTISDIYLANYDQEEFNNFVVTSNAMNKYQKVKDLKLKKIDVSGIFNELEKRNLLNKRTSFFMSVDICRFISNPKDMEGDIWDGVYLAYLSQRVYDYFISDFINYLSVESIKELENKLNQEESAEESEEESDSQELIESYKNDSNELRKINEKLKEKIQKLKNKEQELDDILQKKRKLVKGLDAAIERRINQLNKKLPEGHIPI